MTSRRRPASSPAARQTAEADRPKLKTLAQRMREGVLDALGLDGRPARRKPRIESLEPRVYMSASPAPVMVGDRLHIELGAGDDQVVIEQLAPGSGGAADLRVRLTLDGQASSFDFSGVRSVEAQGGAGNDTIELFGPASGSAVLESVTYQALGLGEGQVEQQFTAGGSLLAIDYAGIEHLVDHSAARQRVFLNSDGIDETGAGTGPGSGGPGSGSQASRGDEAWTVSRLQSGNEALLSLARSLSGTGSGSGYTLIDAALPVQGLAFDYEPSQFMRLSFDDLGALDATVTARAGSVTVRGVLLTQGHNIDISAVREITLEADAVLSTRALNLQSPTAGGDTFTGHAGAFVLDAVSTANSGSVVLSGLDITLQAGSKLLSHVEAGSSHTAGDITITAKLNADVGNSGFDYIGAMDPTITVGSNAAGNTAQTDVRGARVSLLGQATSDQVPVLGLNQFGGKNRVVDISLGKAAISGSSVSIVAEARDVNLLSRDLPSFSTYASELLVLPIPLGLQVRYATATVLLSDSSVVSSGNVTIGTKTVVDGTVTALAAGTRVGLGGFSGSASVVNGTAQTRLEGATSVRGGGNVKVQSDVTTIASALSRGTANLPSVASLVKPANAWSVGATVAITKSNTAAHTSLGEHASISAGGNVDFSAKGDLTNKAKADVAVYTDGLAGIGIVASFDDSDIRAQVDGSISAGGSPVGKAISLAGIDNTTNTLHLVNHGFNYGEQVVYLAQATEDAGAGKLQAIGGLQDGHTYTVLVIDQDSFQLAEAGGLVIDAAGVSADSQQSLTPRRVLSFDAAQATVDTGDDTITLVHAHGWADGQRVDYLAASQGDAIGGLVSGASYEIERVGDTGFKLKDSTGTVVHLTSGGSGAQAFGYNVQAGRVSFNAGAAGVVSAADRTITFTNAHGLATGDAVVYQVDDMVAHTGTIKRGASFFTSPQVVEFDPGATMDGQATLDLGSNTIVLPSAGMPFVTGQRVTYSSGALGAIGGLASQTDYFVIVTGDQTIQLSTSRALALAGQGVVDLTSVGAAGLHRLTAQGVDAADNIVAAPGHGLETGQQITYRAGGTAHAIAGLTDGGTLYAIARSGDLLQLASSRPNALAGIALDIGAAGGGTTQSFESTTIVQKIDATRQVPVVDLSADTIEIAAHGFMPNQEVVYRTSGGAPIGGLQDGTHYFVITGGLDANHLKLATTAQNAQQGIAINLAAGATLGAAGHALEPLTDADPVRLFDATALKVIDEGGDRIYQYGHGYKTGDRVTYLNTGGAAIGGLVAGQDYFVVRVDDNLFSLATREADAKAATPVLVNLGAGATGSGHGFERASLATVGDAPIRGLDDGGIYFVTVVDDHTIRLAASESEARAALAKDLDTATATGTAHVLKGVDSRSGVNVSAELKSKNFVGSQSSVGSAPTIKDILTKPELASSLFAGTGRSTLLSIINPFGNTKDILKGTFQSGSGSSPITVAAGVAYNQVNHAVAATLGATAHVTSGQDVKVATSLKELAQVFAQGNASPDRGKKGFVGGLAVAVANYTNTSDALIAGGAVVDARRNVTVDAQLHYPSLLSEYEYNARGIVEFLSGRAGLDKFSNIMALSKAQYGTTKIAAAGSVAVATYQNRAHAEIGDGAMVNQGLGAAADPAASVTVHARTDMDMVNAAGVLSLKLDESGLRKDLFSDSKFKPAPRGGFFSSFGTEAEYGTLGGSFVSQSLDNETTALVSGGAKVHTANGGKLAVRADEVLNSLEIAHAGGRAGVVGASGAVPWLNHDSRTLAQVGSGVDLTVGGLDVAADSDAHHTMYAGAVQLAGVLGLGVSAGIANVNRDVQALIGERQRVVRPADVNAATIALDRHGFNTGDEVIYRSPSMADRAMSSATAASPAIGGLTDGQRYFVIKVDDQHVRLASSAANAQGGTAITLTAPPAGSFHTLERAGSLPQTEVSTVSTASLHAQATGEIINLALAGALPSPVKPPQSVEQVIDALQLNQVVLAGSAAVNHLADAARAYVNTTPASRLRTGGAFGIEAVNDTSARSGTGAAAATIDVTALNQVALAGAVSINRVDTLTDAFVAGGTINAGLARDLTLQATRAGQIHTGAASLAGALNGAVAPVAAASVSINQVNDWTHAYLSGTQVNAVALSLTAKNGADIKAGGGALGGSRAAVAAAFGASVALNTVHAEVGSWVLGSKVTASSALTSQAVLDTKLGAYAFGFAGAFALGGGQVAVSGGGAGADNQLQAWVQAGLRSSDVDAAGDITLLAQDASDVEATAAGAAVAVQAGSPGLAAGVGASHASNTERNLVQASIEGVGARGTGVQAGGKLDLTAQTVGAAIEATSVAVAIAANTGGLSLAGGGSSAVNTVDNRVRAFVGKQAIAKAAGGVEVKARDKAVAMTVVPDVAIAVSNPDPRAGVAVAVGVSLSANTVSSQVEAYVDHAQVSSGGGAVKVDARSARTASATNASVAISTTLGLAVAQGGSDITGHTKAWLGAQADVLADTVEVTALLDAQAKVDVHGGGAALLAVDAMLGTAVVNSAVLAAVEDAASVSAKNLAVRTQVADASGNDVPTSRRAQADVVVGTVSIAGGNGGKASASVAGDVEARIGNATVNLAGGGALKVDAASTNVVDAHMPGGGAGAVAVSAMTSEAMLGGSTRASLGGTLDAALGQVSVGASTDNTTNADVLAASIGLGGGAGGRASATQNSRTESLVRDGALLQRVGALGVTAQARNTVTTDARGGAGGGVAIGGFEAVSTLASLNDTQGRAIGVHAGIGKVAGLNARTVQVGAGAEQDVRANLLTVGVGLLAGSGGTAQALSTGNVLADIVSDGARMTVDGASSTDPAVRISASADDRTSAVADGGSGGGISASALFADARNHGNTQASLQADMDAAGVDVLARAGRRDVDASITVGGVALGSGVGGRSEALADGNITADLARSVHAAGRNVVVKALDGHSTVDAVANGGAGGAVAASGFVAKATLKGATTATVKNGADLSAHHFTLDAEAQGGQASGRMYTLGLGIGAGSGGSADALLDTRTKAVFGEGAVTTLNATGQVLIQSGADQAAKTDVDAVSGGGLAVGSVNTTLQVSRVTSTSLGADAVVNAGGGYTQRAQARLLADADASCQAGALIPVALSGAALKVNDLVDTVVGDRAKVRAGGDVLVEAKQALDLGSSAFARAIGLGGGNAGASGTVTQVDPANAQAAAAVRVRIGTQAEISGAQVVVRALQDKLDVDVTGQAAPGGVATTGSASLTLDSTAITTVAADARITARTGLTVGAYHDSFDARVDAQGFGLFAVPVGGSTSVAVHLTTETEVAAGAILKAGSTIALDAAASRPLLSVNGGTGSLSDARNLKVAGTLITPVAPNPVLEVDAAGHIVRAENVSASVDAAARTVRVAAIAANASTQKSVLFRFNPTDGNGQPSSTSVSGTTTSFTGKAIVKHGGYTAVDLVNNSNYALVLDGMNLTPTNDQAVDKVSFDDGLGHAGDYETSLDASATTPAITVSNLGSAALRLAGAIYNPNGGVALASGAGGIASASSQARVTGRSVDLQAAGALGSIGANLLVHTQALAARAGTGMAIDNSQADLVVDRLSSGAGEIRLKTAGSLSGKPGATDFSAPAVWLESSSGSLGSAAAALQLNTASFGGNAQVDIHVKQAGGPLALGTLSAGSGSIDVALADTPDVGRDLLTLGAASRLSAGGDIMLQAGDGIGAALGSRGVAGGRIILAADVAVAPGTDPDTAGAVLDLQGSLTADSVLVRTGAGVDDITLRSVQSATELDAGAGNDDITVGGGRLDQVSAALTIDAGAGQDRVAFDDRQHTGSSQGSLRAAAAQGALTGLGTADGIAFAGAEELGLALGDGNDELQVTEVGAGIGATLNLGGGADTLHLGNLAGATGLGLTRLQGALAIDAGAQDAGAADALILSAAHADNGQEAVLDGVLAQARLTGLGLGAQGLTFAGFESVDLSLGAAADHLAITGVAASARTTVHAGAGRDAIEVGSLAEGSSLTAIAAALVLDAGADGAGLAVGSGATADLALERLTATQGRIVQAQASGSIVYDGFDALSVALGGGNDRVAVRDTVAALTLATGGGRDEVGVETVSNATDVDLGSGADTITVKAARQALSVHGGALDGDELVIDVSAHATGDSGALSGSGLSGSLAGLTAAAISFDNLSQLTLNLGQGNDRLDIDEALSDTAVSVRAGAGADQFDVRRIGSRLTSLTGQTGVDRVTVFIAGRPVAGAFGQLGLGVEKLEVDNTANTQAEAWTVSDGDSIDALVGEGGSRASVIAAAGAQNFVILGGTAADTLTVESNTSSAVSGTIDGNSVSLNTARAVLVPGSFTRLPAAEGVIDFDGLLNGSNTYAEDGFTLQAGSGGLSRDDRLGPAARVDAGRTVTLSSSSGGLALSGLRLASDVAGAPVVVTITGTTINGKTVVATVVLPAKGAAHALPVFQDATSASVFADPGFGLLQSVSFSGNGAFLLDKVAAQAMQSGAGTAQAPAALATITLGMNGRDDLGSVANILLDTRTPGAAAVVIDRNRNGVADGNEPRYTASTDVTSAVPFTARESGGVVEFDFLGNLVFGAGTSGSHRQVCALGSSAVRVVANNISIGQFVDFNFSAVNATAGPGGGAGANTTGQVVGGGGTGGSVANTTIIGGGSNGEGGDNGSGSSNGSAGGDGRTPQDGMSLGAPLSNPGTNGTAGTGGNAGGLGLNNVPAAVGLAGLGNGNGGGGAAGTPGANGTGGGGGTGRSLFNQGNGGAGTNGTPGVVGNTGQAGGPGAAGHPGGGGSNSLSGTDLNALSGGSGGGSGGAGGGGGGGGAGGYGGAGGGGGGGGSGYSGTTIYPGGDGGDGGRGGQGGAGGNGTSGAGGGAGGGGGGALELRALGQIVAGGSVGFAAVGGNGSPGGTSSAGVGGGSPGESAPGQKTGLFGSGWQAGNPGSSGIGGAGGTGGAGANGGHGGAGGRGGNGGSGGGGAGGTIKLAGSVLDLTGVSINVGGGKDASGVPSGGGGRVIQTTNEPTGSGATTTGALEVRDGSDERSTVNPYVKQSGGSLSTPYLADVQGRADSFGLLDGVGKSNLSFAAVAASGVTGSATIPDANKNALAAVIRVPADSLRLATDAYDGYDLLVFVNLSDTMALGNPQLGVAANGLTPDPRALQVYAASGAGDLGSVLGGAAVNHGSADYKNLGALEAGKVWAMLVPKTTALGMTASVDFAGRTYSVAASSMAANSVYFINYTASAGTTAGADLPALTQIVASPTADKLVYAISPDSQALVVLNPGDLSERQMLRDGSNGVSGLAGVSSLALSGNGSFVITGSSAANGGLTVFQRDAYGNLGFVATQAHLGQATWTAVATSPGAPQAVFSVGAGGVAKTLLDAGGHPALVAGSSGTNAAVTGDHIAVSRDGRLVYVSDSSQDRLVVLDADTLQELQRFDGALGLDGASAIEVSADDGSVYLACTVGDRLAVFARSGNGLALVQIVNNLSQGVRGLDGATDLALTPDQRLLLVAGAEDNSVAVFARDAASGTLSFLQRLRNGVDGLSGLDRPMSITASADGSQVYVGAAGSGTQPAGVITLGHAALGAALPPPAQQRTEFDGIETLDVQLGSGADDLQLLAAPEAGDIEIRLRTGGGDDRAVLSDLPRKATVDLGGGADRVQLSASRAGTEVTVLGGEGADEIVIERAGAGSRIEAFGGTQADTMRVAGAALPLSAAVLLHGDELNTAPYDKLVFDPQDANPLNLSPTVPDSHAGTLQAGQRSGGSFTPTSGLVTYDTFEAVQVVTGPLIALAPLSIAEGGGLSLAASITLLGGATSLSAPLAWDVDGDGEFDDAFGNNLALSWADLKRLGINDSGRRSIGVRATSADGVSTASTSLVIADVRPTVLLQGGGTARVGAPYAISFNSLDLADDSVTGWYLDWGDGSAIEALGSNAYAASHVYAEPGSYTVRIGAEDEDTAGSPTYSNAVAVAVAVDRSQVQAGGPYRGEEGSVLTLSASAVGTPVSWAWDLDGDGSFDDAVGQTTSLTPADDGSFAAGVRVTYADGSVVDSYSTPVTVLNRAPTAAALVNGASVEEGGAVSVSFVGATDASSADLADGLRYSFDVDNDGSFEVTNATTPTVTLDGAWFRQAGVATVRGRVADQDGGFVELLTRVTVREVAPTLAASGSGTAVEGEDYVLALSAQDPGADTVSRWIVDWADGSVESFDAASAAPGAPQVLTHRFSDDGAHVVRITAIDQDGAYTTTHAVDVGNAAPSLQLGTVGTLREGQSVRVAGLITDAGAPDRFSLDVDWGDGQTERITLGTSVRGFEISHVYGDDGDYVVHASIADDDGGMGAATLDLQVANEAPRILGMGPDGPEVAEGGLVTVTGRLADPGLADRHQVTLAWGDGSTSLAAIDPVTRQWTATHRYLDDDLTGSNNDLTDRDTFSVVATVSDEDGGQSSASAEVTVLNVFPTVANVEFTETLTDTGLDVVIRGSFTDPGVRDVHAMLVDWGDQPTPPEGSFLGNFVPVEVDEAGHSFELRHHYADSSIGYQATTIFTDDDGAFFAIFGGYGRKVFTTSAFPVNHAPVAGDDSYVALTGTELELDLKANDSDPDGDATSLLVLTAPAHGTLRPAGDGRFVYKPDAGFTGDDRFTYRLSDGQAASNLATVSVRTRNPSYAADDAVTLDEDGSAVFDVRANDVEVNAATVVSGPAHGSVALRADGSFVYTPHADYNGADRFTYRSDDPYGIRTEAVVDITVRAVNDAPVVQAIADIDLLEGRSTSLQVQAADADHDALSYSVAGAGASIDAQGRLSFAADDGNAVRSVTVSVSDGQLVTQRSFNVRIANVAPTLTVTGAASVPGGQPCTLQLGASDPGRDTISQWVIDWGDGRVDTLAGNATQASHTYARTGGNFSIRATATDEDGSYAAAPLDVAVQPDLLKVSSMTSTATGVKVRFDHVIDTTAIGLWFPTNGKADVQLKGDATGIVSGSIVLDEDGRGFTFIRTGGVLASDSYTLTLASGTAAFHDAAGGLDGNGDGRGGDDYVARFDFRPARGTAVISLPDFMRGPGQAVNVPALGLALPVTYTTGTSGLHQVVFTVDYDTRMLSITGARATLGLPLGTTISFETVSTGLNTQQARITVTLPGRLTLPAGSFQLASLVASVPAGAPYGACEVLRIKVASLNGNAPAAGSVLSDDALHVVGYFGDANGDAAYTPADVQQILRVVSKADPGFAAWRNVDPVSIAGVTGGSGLSALDANALLLNVGLPVLPRLGSINFYAGPATAPAAVSATLVATAKAAATAAQVPAQQEAPAQVAMRTAATQEAAARSLPAEPAPTAAALPRIDLASPVGRVCETLSFGHTRADSAWLQQTLGNGGERRRIEPNARLRISVPGGGQGLG